VNLNSLAPLANMKPHAPSLIQKIGIVPVNAREAAPEAELPDELKGNDLERHAAFIERVNSSKTPAHYDKPVTPWMLQEHMETSGNAFVDARRADAIEYAFRIKDDLKADLIKAKHCLEAAIAQL